MWKSQALNLSLKFAAMHIKPMNQDDIEYINNQFHFAVTGIGMFGKSLYVPFSFSFNLIYVWQQSFPNKTELILNAC